MSGTGKEPCDVEPAGSGTTDAAAEFDPFGADESESSPFGGETNAAPAGLPVSDADYRALKERARTLQWPAPKSEQTIAQEDGDGVTGRSWRKR